MASQSRSRLFLSLRHLNGQLLYKRNKFTVQRMLVNQNAVFLPGHAVSSMKAI